MRRLLNFLVALDQFLFCLITLGHSNPDETISSAAWRWENTGHWMGWIRPVIDAIFFFDKYHCRKSWEAEQYR
jgi:hypothetical protein